MSTVAKYDPISDEYAESARNDANKPDTIMGLATQSLLGMLTPVNQMAICDLACGEGYLRRQLANMGAEVTGVDISKNLRNYSGEYTPKRET